MIRRVYPLIVIGIVFSLFLLASCSECSQASDCTVSGSCKTPICKEGKCSSVAEKDCCGNGIQEKTESGQSGNKCTCPSDYGECTSKATIMIKNKKVDAQYLTQRCDDTNDCVYSVDPSIVKRNDLSFDKELPFFTFDSLVTYNTPFTIGKDKVDVTFTLKNDNPDLIYPIRITGVKLIDGQTLFGNKDSLQGSLGKIGDKFAISIPITYEAPYIEEERSVTLRVDYEYQKRIKGTKNEDGTYNYTNELVRDTFDSKLSKKIFFLYPQGVKE